MNKKRKNILVWVFTWAGLLLAILYSPIGSPGLYKSSINYTANQNIDFGGGSIENAKNLNFETGNDYNELNVPNYNSDESSSKLSSGNYSYATSIDDKTSSAGTSYSSSESQSYQNLKNGSSVGSAGGSSFISNNASGSSSASSAVTMNSGGIATLSASTTILASNTKAAGVGYDPNKKDGGQNPGGDPEQNTRIPVPDGWVFLLFLAMSYGIIKRKFFTI